MRETTGCEICCNAFGSGVACKRCRKDPANREWIAQLDGDAQALPVPQRWVVNDLERRIARELLFGTGTIRGAARAVGCKPEQARWFVNRLLSIGRSNRRRSDGTSATLPAPAPECSGHQWSPASDAGLAMYSCIACGWYGRRDLLTGAINPTTTEPEGARPAPTVDFKTKWSPDDRRRLQKALPLDRNEGAHR